MRYESDRPLVHPGFLVQVHDAGGAPLFLLNSDYTGDLPETLPAVGEVVCLTAPLNLTPGRCYVAIEAFKGPTVADVVENAATFDVEPEDYYGTGKAPKRDWVLCALPHQWQAGA